MIDAQYIVSLLGFANLIELVLLAGGFISVCIASTGYAKLVDSYMDVIKYNVSQTDSIDPMSFYDINAYTIKIAGQSIFMIIFGLTLITCIVHIIFSLRYRYVWHRISNMIGFLCIIYAFAVFGVSVVVACWEDKLRKRLTNAYLNNRYINTPNGSVKPHIGSAAAAATFGFAASLIFLVEALIRFRRLVDKTQI